MDTLSNKADTDSVPEPSEWAKGVAQALQEAVAEAIERKRKLGQYWVVWDGEKPVKVYPDTAPAADHD